MKTFIFLLALTSLLGCDEAAVSGETVAHFDFPESLGLDSDGFLAACSNEGVAQSINRSGSLRTIETRFKDGRIIRCMTKDEAKSYMASQKADPATMSYVLNQYPVISQQN